MSLLANADRTGVAAVPGRHGGDAGGNAAGNALLGRAGFRLGQVMDLGIGGECVIVASPGQAD